MVLVDNPSFMLRVEKIANMAKQNSFTVTFKRFDGKNKPTPKNGNPLPEPVEYMCLIRAQSRSKKISTIVRQEDVPVMMGMYAQFMKSKMDGLKRLKKAKSKVKVAKG